MTEPRRIASPGDAALCVASCMASVNDRCPKHQHAASDTFPCVSLIVLTTYKLLKTSTTLSLLQTLADHTWKVPSHLHSLRHT